MDSDTETDSYPILIRAGSSIISCKVESQEDSPFELEIGQESTVETHPPLAVDDSVNIMPLQMSPFELEIGQESTVETHPPLVAVDSSRPGLTVSYPFRPDDDSWVQTWDQFLHPCVLCGRVYGSKVRLENHHNKIHLKDAKTDVADNSVVDDYDDDLIDPDTDLDASTITLSPTGDLVLTFQEGGGRKTTRSIRVASQVLTAASPVFKRMLDSTNGFHESLILRKAQALGKCLVLELEDDGETFEFILKILYYQLPSKDINHHTLFKLAEAADKYEMVNSLKFFASVWIKPMMSSKAIIGFEDLITVAWVFELKEEFRDMSEELIWRGYVSNDGGFFLDNSVLDSRRTLSETLPNVVIDRLYDLRASRMSKIIFEINQIRSRYLYKKDATRHICNRHDGAMCDILQYGVLMKMSIDCDLEDAATWNGSTQDLVKKLEKTQVYRIDGNHRDCSWVPRFLNGLKAAKGMTLRLNLEEFPSRRCV